jgi:hypothetical protein
MDNLPPNLKLKLHEDKVVRMFETMERVDMLIAMKYLPHLLNLYGGDINWEIDMELKKELKSNCY